MKIAVFCVFFIASFAIGATPILIGVALVYAVAWILAKQQQPKPSAATSEPPPEPQKPTTPPPFGETRRKMNL